MEKTFLILISIFSLNIAFAQEEIIEIQEEREVLEIFTVVETMPIFQQACAKLEDESKKNDCNMKSIQSYMARVKYPQLAVDNEVQGKVYVSFVVDVDGSVIDVTLLRGVDKLLDDAAMEHLRNMPKFYSPGYQRGKPVKVKYIIPINFHIDLSDPLSKKELRALKKKYRKKQRILKKK